MSVGVDIEPSLHDRVAELERRLDEAADIKAELAHWIGEAKRYERLYRSVDERATRWYRERGEARAELARLRGEDAPEAAP